MAAMSDTVHPQSLRVGVIGTGCIGLEHIRNLHLVKGARVSAICDPHEPSRVQAVQTLKELGDFESVSVLEDFRALLALPNVDAVIVCTPNDHHAECLPAVVESGKHCLVEKPLCTELNACAAIEVLVERAREAARAAGQPQPLFWCGMEYRYIPSIARLVREAEDGVAGELRMLSIREHRFPFLRKVDNWNRFTSRTGGTLVEKCCHFFDLMRLILRSEPLRIMATGGQDANFLHESYDGQSADVLDNAYVIVEFVSGARACLELCMFAEASKNQEEISLVGTHGKLEAFSPSHGVKTDDPNEVNFRRGVRNPSFAQGQWSLVDPPSPDECGTVLEAHEGVSAALLEAGNHGGATYEELVRFTESARGKREPEVSLRDGSMAVLMGIAAHRSIATGEAVLWSTVLSEYEVARTA